MTKTFQITVLGGDGIGPEVCEQAVRLIQKIQPLLPGVQFDLQAHAVGVTEYQRSGNALPSSALAACRQSDAVLLGAMGLPSVRYPDGKEITPQIDLRDLLDLYGGVRPAYLYYHDDSPLKGYQAGEIDFVLVRESTEGLFYGRGSVADLEADHATDELKITRTGSQRVCRLAFELARQRDKGKKVTLVDKANVLSSMVYFRHVFDEVAAEYPDITTERIYVDAAAMFLVRRPEDFDVLVTENMFGDILSDLAAGIVGGLGMAPSADIGKEAAVFQPVHGSAPDIAGQGIANPTAMILSTAMMFDWLGHQETKRAASAINDAVRQILSDPAKRTPDMNGTLTTKQMANAIMEQTIKSLS